MSTLRIRLFIIFLNRLNQKNQYLPIFHIDYLSIKDEEYKVIFANVDGF